MDSAKLSEKEFEVVETKEVKTTYNIDNLKANLVIYQTNKQEAIERWDKEIAETQKLLDEAAKHNLT